MATIFEKLQSSKDLNKGINTELINGTLFKVEESIKKTFAHSLKVAQLFGKANDYIGTKQAKDELKRLNVEGNKYVIFGELFGLKETQIKLYIAVSKIPADVVAEFQTSNISQTLVNLKKFAKQGDEESEPTTNLTKEGISEYSKTDKGQKFSTTKKGIDIKVNAGVTAEDIAEAIKYLQSLQVK